MGIIGSIRKRGWIAVVVVGVAIICFIIGDFAKKQPNMPDMGKINGKTITSAYFNQRADEMIENYRQQQQMDQLPSEVEYQIREQAWQVMVEEQLNENQYNRLGLRVTSSEVSDMFAGSFIHPYLRQIFTNPQTGEYNVQQIRSMTDNFDMLDSTSKTQWVQLEKAVKQDRLQQKYNMLISKAFYMPKAMAAQVADMSSDAANVRVAALRFQNVADEEANPTQADYEKYYKEHKAEYRIREELRELDFIVFPVNPTPADLQAIEENVNKTWEEFQQVEDKDIMYFVNDECQSASRNDTIYKTADAFSPLDSIVKASNPGTMIAPRIVGNDWVMARVTGAAMRPDSLRVSAIWILNKKAGGEISRSEEEASRLTDSIADLLRTGKMPFEQAVAEFSDDPAKAENKGDLNWVPDGYYGFLNERVVNTPVGNFFTMERPDKTGHVIALVTGKTEPHMKYKVAMITLPITPSEQTDGEIYAKANHFAGQNRTHAAMMSAAQAENLAVRNAIIPAMANSLQGVNGNARSIVQWAFNDETENGSVANQVFSTGEYMYVVVALKDILKKGYLQLEQVRNMIEQPVRLEKKGEILMAKAEEALKTNKNIDTLASQLGTTVDSVNNVRFNDYYFDRFGMEPKVQAAIAATKQNSLIGPIKGTSAVYMVQVDGVVKGEEVSADMIRNNMESEEQQKVRSLIQVLKDNAKITDQRNKYF